MTPPMSPRAEGPGHIVMIVADYVPAMGGTTTQTRLHAAEFARRGWAVTVLTRRTAWGQGRDTVDGLPVRRLGVPGRSRLAKLPQLLAIWGWLVRRRRSITAVHVVMEPDFALCAVSAGLASSTVLTWVTDGDATRTLRGRRGVLRRRALAGRTQVALTPRMRTEVQNNGLTDVHVIPVPVDLERFRPPTADERADARRSLGVDAGTAIVYVGHLQERKGADRLLTAVKRLFDEGTGITLLLVGGPVEAADVAYVAALHRFVSDNGIGDHVRFFGAQADVVPYLHAADVFCLPSSREGMPIVLIEALACGLACVAPRQGGGDAVLGDGVGVIARSNDPDELADVLRALLASPARREALALDAAAYVRAKHRIGPIVDAYEALFSNRADGARPFADATSVADGGAESVEVGS